LIIILSLALLITSYQPLNLASANILEVSFNDIYLTAGEINEIEIVLKNVGELDIYSVEALLSSENPNIQILEGSHKVYPEIGNGKTVKYKPSIYINQDSPLGAYNLMLNVKYIKYGTIYDSSVTVPIGIILSRGFSPKLSLSSSNVNVKSGITTEIEYIFKNDGQVDLKNIELTLSSDTNSIAIIEGGSLEIGELKQGEIFTITPKISILKGTPISAYTLTGIMSYTDVEENRYHQTFTLPINVDSTSEEKSTIITIKKVEILKNEVRPGDQFPIEIQVECQGADSYDVSSKLSFGSSSNISPITPTMIYLGDIKSGDSSNIKYELLASGEISAGPYPIIITVTYTNSKGQLSTLTESITILIEPFIEFEVLEDEPLEVYGKQIAEFEADLLLIGTENVQFVSIELVENDLFSRIPGSTEYIGAVDPDSPIPFDINFEVSEDAEAGKQPLQLKIHYRDHLNRVHDEFIDTIIDLKEGEIPEENQQSQGGLFGWLRRLFS
jgi:hypothetical protein